MFPFLGEGIFVQDGTSWKHSRDLLRRPFLKAHYQDLKGFSGPIENLLRTLTSANGIVDLQPLFFQFTLETTTALIFGHAVEHVNGNNQDDFASAFDYASLVSALRSRLTDFHWVYNPSGYRDACNSVKDFADGFVKRALGAKEDSNRYAFIEDLYSELQDPVLVRDQLVNVLLAGRDTTACLLSWAL